LLVQADQFDGPPRAIPIRHAVEVVRKRKISDCGKVQAPIDVASKLETPRQSIDLRRQRLGVVVGGASGFLAANSDDAGATDLPKMIAGGRQYHL
jgi:hypothetical protein